MEYSRITNLLKKEVLPALGCTGPVAVALAAARAAAEVDGSIKTDGVWPYREPKKGGMR